MAEQVSVVGAGRATGDGAIDYVISVEGVPHFLIEAKGPKSDRRSILDEKAAIQQINTYCHAHAHQPRWGVLTNGLIWAIYDSRAKCDVFNRRILTVDISTEPDLLRALSAGWRGHLERFADELNGARAVPKESIRNRAIRDIEREYKELFAQVAPTVTPAAPTKPEPAKPATATKAVPGKARPHPAPTGVSAVASFTQPPEIYGKPTRLLLPTGELAIKSWATVLVETANYLVAKGLLKPDSKVEGTGRVLVTKGAPPENLNSAKLSNGWNIVTNWSAADCVRVTGELLKSCGRDPGEFSVDYDRAKPKKP